MYQDADVYFFDDPLSAVDSHVGKHIFKQVLGPNGLLKDKVRILTTNALHVLPACDRVVVMRGGRISEQGTYEELNAAGGEFSRLITEFSENNNNASEEGDEEPKLEPDAAVTQVTAAAEGAAKSSTEAAASAESRGAPGQTQSSLAPAAAPNSSSAASASPLPRSVSGHSVKSSNGVAASKSINTDGANGKTQAIVSSASSGIRAGGTQAADPGLKSIKNQLITKEEMSEGGVKFSVYKRYFRAISYELIALLTFLYVITYGAQVGSSIWLSFWSSDNDRKAKDPSVHIYSLATYLGVYAGLGLGNSVGILLVSLLMAFGSIRASRRLHESMLNHVVRAPMAFFDTTPMGRILNRFSKDIYNVDESVPSSLRSFIGMLMQVLSIIAVISYSTPIFMAAILPMGFLYYYIQRYYIATSRQLKRLESVSRSPIYAHFSETLSGVTSIRAYQRQSAFVKENEDRVDLNMQAYYPGICANRWLALRLEFVGNCIIFFAALFCVLDRKHIPAGIVGLSLSYAMSVTQTLNWMVRMSTQLETDIVAIERVEEYCAIPVERPAIEPHRPNSSWPEEGKVLFDDYAVRYRPTLDLVLRGISADVQGGEKIGIVGRTGAGKSSLTLALFRLLEPAGGKIVIDGEDITGMGLEDLRSRLTIMPQDPVLFSGSIRRNLDPFSKATDAELWRALETCHLSQHIKTLPKGLDSEVAEGGENFRCV